MTQVIKNIYAKIRPFCWRINVLCVLNRPSKFGRDTTGGLFWALQHNGQHISFLYVLIQLRQSDYMFIPTSNKW